MQGADNVGVKKSDPFKGSDFYATYSRVVYHVEPRHVA